MITLSVYLSLNWRRQLKLSSIIFHLWETSFILCPLLFWVITWQPYEDKISTSIMWVVELRVTKPLLEGLLTMSKCESWDTHLRPPALFQTPALQNHPPLGLCPYFSLPAIQNCSVLQTDHVITHIHFFPSLPFPCVSPSPTYSAVSIETSLFPGAFQNPRIQVQFSSVQSLSHVWLFATPWTAACQASLSITNCQSTQTHVHWVSDAIQPSHALSSPSPPALDLSQY